MRPGEYLDFIDISVWFLMRRELELGYSPRRYLPHGFEYRNKVISTFLGMQRARGQSDVAGSKRQFIERGTITFEYLKDTYGPKVRYL